MIEGSIKRRLDTLNNFQKFKMTLINFVVKDLNIHRVAQDWFYKYALLYAAWICMFKYDFLPAAHKLLDDQLESHYKENEREIKRWTESIASPHFGGTAYMSPYDATIENDVAFANCKQNNIYIKPDKYYAKLVDYIKLQTIRARSAMMMCMDEYRSEMRDCYMGLIMNTSGPTSQLDVNLRATVVS